MSSFQQTSPDIVIHTAGKVGGLQYNLNFKGEIFHDNLLITVNLLEAARKFKVKKNIFIGSSCAYPGEMQGAYKESDLFSGPLHSTTEPFGFWKQSMLIGARAYRAQYDLHTINLILTNLYGPRDDYSAANSHVVGALLRKFFIAKKNGSKTVTCWGSGKAVRECNYVEDMAEGILLAAEKYERPEPMNMGSGIGTSIRVLAETISDVIDFKGEIVWDKSKSDGALLKQFDTTYMQNSLGWRPPTSLVDGLKKSIAWLEMNHSHALEE